MSPAPGVAMSDAQLSWMVDNDISRLLQAVPGVERATVVLDRGSAEVEFDPARTGIAALKLAVEEAGYEPV